MAFGHLPASIPAGPKGLPRRALRASGDDADAAGAGSAAEVLYGEADRLDRLAGEVRALRKRREVE